MDNGPLSEPTLELHSRAAPSVGGITAQSVLPQGRKKANMATFHHFETACPHFSYSLLQSDKIDSCYCVLDLLCVNGPDLNTR